MLRSLKISLRHGTATIALASLLLLGGLAYAQPAAVHERFASEIRGLVDIAYPSLDLLYKDLHAAPELAFQEVKTAARLAKEMRALGYEVTEGIGKTGIVAILKNGAGPMILVRTELDALPMEEKSSLPYASKAKATFDGKETFVAHSCGHDIHMAAWVGAARTLAAMKSKWQGTLMFVGQPAEETVSGARAMLNDGLFSRFGKPDYAFALHSSAGPVGSIGYNVGAITSNSDGLQITFKGRGGHGSAPHFTIDPILIAARFTLEVQAVISREKDPGEFGVVTVGAIQAGTVGNIIPDSALVRGTIRSYKPAVRDKLLEGVRRVANAAAAMSNAPAPDVELAAGGAAVMNDEAVVKGTEIVLKAAFGDVMVQRMQPITASEDFSEFLNAGVPGMMFFMGAYDSATIAEARRPGGKPLAFNHSPFYAPVPEPTIKTGVTAMSLAVLQALQKR